LPERELVERYAAKEGRGARTTASGQDTRSVERCATRERRQAGTASLDRGGGLDSCYRRGGGEIEVSRKDKIDTILNINYYNYF
jgi:hypothetical protein